jgi:hypothetical protein
MTDALTVAKELCGPPADAERTLAELPRLSGLVRLVGAAGVVAGCPAPRTHRRRRDRRPARRARHFGAPLT